MILRQEVAVKLRMSTSRRHSEQKLKSKLGQIRAPWPSNRTFPWLGS